MSVKVPKGTRDINPEQMVLRNRLFKSIESVFQKHGAMSIDTPVFELQSTLMNKYGEESKLIYELADQGGELCALRYDLTVPFARYMAEHGKDQMKRYQIGRVYRRDQPAIDRGRFREFFQTDFDIAGTYPPMVPDAECLFILIEILNSLQIGEYKVKLNHRKLLDAILVICNVPVALTGTICSAIDKLDKLSWEEVVNEMLRKGLTATSILQLQQFVEINGTLSTVVAQLDSTASIAGSPAAVQALRELDLLNQYLTSLGCTTDDIVLDLSLARGLNYYTGIIFEAVLVDSQLGSIAAGGRYDNLIGMFKRNTIPSVGLSIGVERIFAIMEQAASGLRERKNYTQVLVASIGNGFLEDRMAICSELWAHGINAEFLYDLNPKAEKQVKYADKSAIPFMIWFGDREKLANNVKIKDMNTKIEFIVTRDNYIAQFKEMLLLARI